MESDKLYSYLCQVSHPAAESNGIFFFHQNNYLNIPTIYMQIDHL